MYGWIPLFILADNYVFPTNPKHDCHKIHQSFPWILLMILTEVSLLYTHGLGFCAPETVPPEPSGRNVTCSLTIADYAHLLWLLRLHTRTQACIPMHLSSRSVVCSTSVLSILFLFVRRLVPSCWGPMYLLIGATRDIWRHGLTCPRQMLHRSSGRVLPTNHFWILKIDVGKPLYITWNCFKSWT